MGKNDRDFATIFKELRLDAHRSQEDVARALHIPRSTVNGWENLGREPGYDTLKAIANYFHCTLDYLLGYTDDILEDNIPPEHRALLQTLQGATKEEVEQARAIIEALRKTKPPID